MEPLYKPEGVEERWQETWEAEGLYEAHADRGEPTFVIAHPPPNVTGELHMGHALQLALADTLVRMKRMQGFNTLFQPGYDHAGISTQNAVEKDLAREGKTRHDLGREAFEARVWEWLRLYGRTIMTQFRRIGASLDYRRERFTMDDDYVRAVMRFFVHLYDKGWIYRDNRIINWCPFHETSLSDLELVHVEVDDALSYLTYPFADGEGGVTIATARPATIPGDVAVAVHPGRRALPGRRRAGGRRSVRREARAGDRRRRGRSGVRHRGPEGHPGPRPARLRDRPAARAPRADGDRTGRADERGGGRPRRA